MHVSPSNLGRQFPIKAWDDQYYDFLGLSEFTLCPAGDYIWTYRFFEAALCGSIPIVQDACEIYKGFEYEYMSCDVHSLKWTEEKALHNYERAVQLLTVPYDVLNDALEEVLVRIG